MKLILAAVFVVAFAFAEECKELEEAQVQAVMSAFLECKTQGLKGAECRAHVEAEAEANGIPKECIKGIKKSVRQFARKSGGFAKGQLKKVRGGAQGKMEAVTAKLASCGVEQDRIPALVVAFVSARAEVKACHRDAGEDRKAHRACKEIKAKAAAEAGLSTEEVACLTERHASGEHMPHDN